MGIMLVGRSVHTARRGSGLMKIYKDWEKTVDGIELWFVLTALVTIIVYSEETCWRRPFSASRFS